MTGEKFYRPELDGLRALAFLAVFGTHAAFHYNHPLPPSASLGPLDIGWWARGFALSGAFGVDLFFVLSGYLITTLLLREEQTHGRIDIPAFWVRRALRIWPAYFVLLGAAFVLNDELSSKALLGFATFTANLFVGAFSPAPVGLGVLWSVQLEEQFYFLWPLLLVLTPRRYRLVLALGLVVLSITSRLVLAGFTLSVMVLTPVRLDGLGVGALLAMLPLSTPSRLVKGLGLTLPLVATVGAALIIQALRVNDGTLALERGWSPAVVLMLVPAMVAVGCGFALWGSARVRWLCWAPLVHLGRISYGLYLVHDTALNVFSASGPWAVPAALVTTVLVAEVSYRFLERPFLRLKERFAYVASGSGTRSAARTGMGPTGRYHAWYKARRITTSDAKETA